MSSKRGFKLTEGDVEILNWVYQLRLLTVYHLQVLTGRLRQALSRRLARLEERDFLYCKKNSLFEKKVYTLNRAAALILVERGVVSAESIDLQVRRLREITDLFLKHALMLTDIHTTLELASRESSIKLVEWREGKELYDSVSVMTKGEKEKLPVRPDAYFVLQDTRQPEGRNIADFFLEADRSTTTNKRFQRKIKGYSNYFKQKLHTKKYGIRSARVITVTLTDERALNLCKAARDVLPTQERKFYYFASMKHFSFESPEHILDEIFISPQSLDTGKQHHLIQPLAK